MAAVVCALLSASKAKHLEKKPRKVEVTRKQVSLKQVVHYGVYGDGTGYIYLEGFKERSADEVREALEKGWPVLNFK